MFWLWNVSVEYVYMRQAQEILQTAEPAVERRRSATSIRGTITKRDAIVIGHIQRTKGVWKNRIEASFIFDGNSQEHIVSNVRGGIEGRVFLNFEIIL